MEPTAVPEDEDRRPRCRLCFHTGDSSQLVEVFSRTRDLSKRVISALGVKINRSEKQARICTVCETIIDIIQSFQAVCKQTNQLYHERKNFLLYEAYWADQQQDAVKITERMILNHRSEVDKTFSDVNTLLLPVKKECLPNATVKPEELSTVENATEIPSEGHTYQAETIHVDIPESEMVLCEPEIKDEPPDNDDSSDEIQEEFDQYRVSSDEAEKWNSGSDSDFRDDEVASEPSEDESEVDRKPLSIKVGPTRGRRKRLNSPNRKSEVKEDVQEQPRSRRCRKKKDDSKKEQTDDECLPREPGKRGPRRKKIRKSDPSVCDICGQTVAYFVKESHHNQHLGVRPYKCDFDGCGRSYYSRNDLRTHSKRHQITYHVCEICGRNIKGVEWFRRHVKTHTEGPQFTCEVCGSKFRRKAQLQTHMVTHTGLTPHECKVCGKRFALKYNLDAHLKRHQKKEDPKPEEEAKEKAEEGPKEVVEKRTWKNYVKLDTSGEKHFTTCETCGKSIHKREMEGHMNKHLGRRPYACDVPGCTLAFYGLRGIKEHKMVVHSDKVIRYDCSICNRSIKGSGTFKRHVMMHNADMKVSCQHCGKKFTSKSYLKAHEMKHTGERPFVCEICGRSFAMKACWKMHIKTVHKPGKPVKPAETKRARKRKTSAQHVKEPEPVAVPTNGGVVIVEQQPPVQTPSSWTINIQTGEQFAHQSNQQQQQVIVQIVEAPNFITENTVTTDHSY